MEKTIENNAANDAKNEAAAVLTGLEAYCKWVETQQGPEAYYEPSMSEGFRFGLEGNVELHELLKVEGTYVDTRMMLDLQHYLFTLLRLSIQRAREDENVHETHNMILDATITIGEDVYSSKNADEFLYAVFEELPEAKSFTVDCTLSGCVGEAFDGEPDEDGEVWASVLRKDAAWTGAGMLDMLEKHKRRNRFEYKQVIFYYNSGDWRVAKILNGKDIDLSALGTEEILSKTFKDEEGWRGEWINIYAEYDFEKQSDILEKCHQLVRECTPESELNCCEDAWDDGELGFLFFGFWDCKNLREVQDYLDKVNAVLLPIKDEVKAGSDDFWHNSSSFGYARCLWTDEGFKIKGLMF